MASISSLMGTGSSGSIYGSRNSNILSGLASGLDTESMIEGLVQSYQQKITGLNQDRTTLQWKQEAYQSISDKLVDFSRKYMSYTCSAPAFSPTRCSPPQAASLPTWFRPAEKAPAPLC